MKKVMVRKVSLHNLLPPFLIIGNVEVLSLVDVPEYRGFMMLLQYLLKSREAQA